MSQIATQIFQLGTHGVEFKQFLAQFEFHLHESGDHVDDLAWLFQIESGSRDAFRDILNKGDETLEVLNDIAFDGFGLIVVFLGIGFNGDMSDQIRLFLGKFTDGDPFETLDNNLYGIVRHAQHTSYTSDCAYLEDVLCPGLLDVSGFLSNKCYEAVATHDVVNEANRALLPYAKRLYGKRIDNGILEGQNR